MGRVKGFKKARRKRRPKAKKGHESDPERTGGEVCEGDSPAWNSLDEAGLWDYHRNYGQQSDSEMEVTKRLSTLNFSMIPCVLDPQALDVNMTAEASDVDLFSELTSATHFDILPTFSDKDNSSDLRQSRKRTSKRRPNKRTKRIKCSIGVCDTNHTSSTGGRKRFMSVPSNLTKLSRHAPMPLKRSRSLRKVKRATEDDLLSCFLSDTSAMCEMDTVGGGFRRDEEDNDMLDSTPPAESKRREGMSETQPELSANDESDLTETTTDSGCEGDDEESSLEGVIKIVGLWEKESSTTGSSSEDEEKLSQILNGAFPLMSDAGQVQFQDHLESFPVFKHPGRFGICGRSGRKKRCKPSQLANSLTLKEINTKIVNFINQTTEVELRFNLISRALCRTIASLAKVYNLEFETEQKRRLPVASPRLRKTLLTRLATKAEIEPILRIHGRDSPTTTTTTTTNLQRKGPAFPSTSSLQQAELSKELLHVVGSQIPALDDSNIGNRMLQGMGWTPGMGLGVHGNGIREPVMAHVRPKHHGLGY